MSSFYFAPNMALGAYYHVVLLSSQECNGSRPLIHLRDWVLPERAVSQRPAKQNPARGGPGSLAGQDNLGWRVRKRIHRDEVHRSAGEYPAEKLKCKAAEAAKNVQWRERDLVDSAKSAFVENEEIRFLNAEFYQSRWEPPSIAHSVSVLVQQGMAGSGSVTLGASGLIAWCTLWAVTMIPGLKLLCMSCCRNVRFIRSTTRSTAIRPWPTSHRTFTSISGGWHRLTRSLDNRQTCLPSNSLLPSWSTAIV